MYFLTKNSSKSNSMLIIHAKKIIDNEKKIIEIVNIKNKNNEKCHIL